MGQKVDRDQAGAGGSEGSGDGRGSRKGAEGVEGAAERWRWIEEVSSGGRGGSGKRAGVRDFDGGQDARLAGAGTPRGP